MRTLKTFIVVALLLLSAMPATATNYPSEIQKLITQKSKSFICKAPSSLFIRVYINPKNMVFIAGYAENEVLISENNGWGVRPIQRFIRTKNGWKKSNNLTEQEENEVEKILRPLQDAESMTILQSCVEAKLRAQEKIK